MKNQTVVITGASSGLGRSLAKKYSDLDYHVCLISRREEKLKEVAKELNSSKTSIYPLDVSSYTDVMETFEKIKTEVGDIDILINNAGTGTFKLAEEIPEEATHQMIDVNLKGTIFCTQAILKDLKKADTGTIINVISTAGLEGKETEAVYCASKFGARGFTESLLVELENTNVRVFGAYMGGMKTEFWDGILDETQTEHMMDPDDIADIIIANAQTRPHINVDQVVIKNR